ncbi:MAG: DNA polymerase III subunit [Vicinamibacterales bacterium]
MPLRSIIGHAPLVALLRQAVVRRRVPQSLLFAGPEGVGKRAVAMALAQAVNCPQQTDGDACGACSTCLRIARGHFSDVTVIDKGDDATIKIEKVRERLLQQVGYRPFEGARRIFILDPADELTTQAQDALLKTLEEPPPSAILMLISAWPDTLAPTIQSRCRKLRFGLLGEADVARVLVERAGVAPAAARPLAAASGGSVARALADERGDSSEDRDAALGLLTAARAGGVGDRLRAAATLTQHGSKRRDREALGARLAATSSLIRDLGTLAAGSTVALANPDVEDALIGLRSSFDLHRVSEAFALVGRAEAALGRNASPKIVADWLAVSL